MKEFKVVGRIVKIGLGLKNDNKRIDFLIECKTPETDEKRVLKKMQAQSFDFIIDQTILIREYSDDSKDSED